jgi:hypothetical protein
MSEQYQSNIYEMCSIFQVNIGGWVNIPPNKYSNFGGKYGIQQ